MSERGKATAGPWRVGEHRSMREDRFYVDTVTDPHKGLLRLIANNLTEGEARQIAAAPALVEALRGIETFAALLVGDRFTSCDHKQDRPGCHYCGLRSVLDHARAALREAGVE